jgi:hypothetical protein
MWWICCLAFNIHRLRAREPRPYLDKKLSVVQVGAGFPRPLSFFQNVRKTGGGFWVDFAIAIFEFLHYNFILINWFEGGRFHRFHQANCKEINDAGF